MQEAGPGKEIQYLHIKEEQKPAHLGGVSRHINRAASRHRNMP